MNELTTRERQVVAQVVTGATNRQISDALGIAVGTVKIHLENARDKIGARNRTELAAMLARQP